jgi:hypothetical protein
MIALGVEAIFTGLSFFGFSMEAVVRWQRLRFVAAAFLPGTWVLFSMTFGRANYSAASPITSMRLSTA